MHPAYAVLCALETMLALIEVPSRVLPASLQGAPIPVTLAADSQGSTETLAYLAQLQVGAGPAGAGRGRAGRGRVGRGRQEAAQSGTPSSHLLQPKLLVLFANRSLILCSNHAIMPFAERSLRSNPVLLACLQHFAVCILPDNSELAVTVQTVVRVSDESSSLPQFNYNAMCCYDHRALSL